MGLNFKPSKNKKSNLHSFLSSDRNYDDIIPLDDVKYYDEYEDVVLNDDMLLQDKINLEKDFYYDDDINSFD